MSLSLGKIGACCNNFNKNRRLFYFSEFNYFAHQEADLKQDFEITMSF